MRSEGKERPVCDDDLPTRVLRLFPTPCADDAQATVEETHRGVGTRKKLIYYARRPVPANWPTPLATDGEKGGPNQHGGHGDLRLPSAVFQYRELPEDRFWRTPNTFDSLTPKSQEALVHELEHRPGRSEPNNLRDQVAVVEGLRRWPTPTAKDADSAANRTATRTDGSKHHDGTTLTDAIRLWPTPQGAETGWRNIEVVDRDGNPPEHFNQRLYNKKTGQIVQKGLLQAAMLPTPMSYSFAESHTPGLTKLDIAVRGLYPGKKYGVKADQESMAREVWPTPLSRDGKGGCQLGRLRDGKISWDNLDQAVQAARPGGLLDPVSPSTPGSRPEQLNADWTEALQGFPAGHTALEPSEMPSSRRKSTRSSPRSPTTNCTSPEVNE